MTTFILKGLEKNHDYFSLKQQFFPFGFPKTFQYTGTTGNGKLIYEKISDVKKSKLLLFFKENNIEYTEEILVETKKIHRDKPIIYKIKNPSHYFYKHQEYGKNIESFLWTDQYNTLFKIENADDSLRLTTTYPGLVIGSGYNHPVTKSDDAYQLGFFFDHTTGLPLISGSSIKGVLRSLFENDEKFAFVQEVYQELYNNKETRIEMIERLFENRKIIFYDAYIIATHNDSKIFASDFITTHHSDKEMGEFMSPTPIKFLKILPEVTWQFQFQAEPKDIALFKQIILDFGLGAKTNVGYGQFRD